MVKNIGQSHTESLLKTINEAIIDKKGENLVNIDLRSLDNAVSEYFVVCHANSDVQIYAIANEILFRTKQNLNERVYNKEGMDNAHWVLLDYVDVVVHIFQTDYRSFYQLEDLWGDAPISEISE
ncbi:MAG: ribosome silencing factor [Bacteroidales bacterium]